MAVRGAKRVVAQHAGACYWSRVPLDASYLDLDIRPAAGSAVACAGRYQPVQRGDGPAALHARGHAAGQRYGPAPRAGEGCGLHAGMGGKAVRVDLGPALPAVARVYQGPIPPLRPGVRYRVGRQQGLTRNLRTRMGAAQLRL